MPNNISLTENGKALIIIDQTLLPAEERQLTLSTRDEFFEAIASLQVRGAPAIGIFAAYAMYLSAAVSQAEDYLGFLAEVYKDEAFLNSARPTAVNLSAMTSRLRQLVVSLEGTPLPKIIAAMKDEAEAIQKEDMHMCRAIAEYGLSLLKEGDGVLTYCNAGELATSRYGTALGPLFLAKEQGMRLHAWCSETRPLLQGARLTTYELCRAGIDNTLICDNMASIVMKEGKVQACLVGCDRVARNGDTANKIGTSAVAILAKFYGIPFYVLGPSSSFDFGCASGTSIEIELRSQSEIKSAYFKEPTALPEVACYNPSFDVTDNSLITAIVTERGICWPPFEDSLRELFTKEMR